MYACSFEGCVNRFEEVRSSEEHCSPSGPRDRIAGSSSEEDCGKSHPGQCESQKIPVECA